MIAIFIRQIFFAVLCISLDGLAFGQDFRLVGTNLYDFSLAGPKSVYCLRGEVTRVYPQTIELLIRTGTSLQFDKSSPAVGNAIKNGGPGEHLQMAAAMAIGQDDKGNPRPISAGQYLAMAPAMRQYFSTVTNYAKVSIINPPPAKRGQVIACIAVPTLNKGFFDCGKPFDGNRNEFKFIYRVLIDRISVERNLSKVTTNAAQVSIVELNSPKSISQVQTTNSVPLK